MKLTVVYDGNTILSVSEKEKNIYTFIDSTSDVVTGTIESLITMMKSIGIADLSKIYEFLLQ